MKDYLNNTRLGAKGALGVAICLLFGLAGCTISVGPHVTTSTGASGASTAGPSSTGTCDAEWVNSIVVNPVFATLKARYPESRSGVGSPADIEPAGLADMVWDCIVVLEVSAPTPPDQLTVSLWRQTLTVLKPGVEPGQVGEYLAGLGFDAAGGDNWMKTSDGTDNETVYLAVTVAGTEFPNGSFPGAKYEMMLQKTVQPR